MAEFKKIIEEHSDTNLSEDMQGRVNAPIEKEGDADITAYASEVMQLIEKGTINVYAPSSLIKEDIYNGLTEQQQDKVDLECANLCGKLRQINQLVEQGHQHTYQMELWVRDIFLSKERLEQELGDVLYL